jgi:cellulose synthase/poly-beta-1,6-N-acetylglucosamine synthase-like glycosyltransferase
VSYLLIIVYCVASVGLFVYSTNCYVLLALFLRESAQRRALAVTAAATKARLEHAGEYPVVTTQIPIFNEANVAKRALLAAAAIDYPIERHEIQVLDDSTDETLQIVDRAAAELIRAGHRVKVLRRTNRTGFKAGALAVGLGQASGDYVGIFDADFIPPRNFYRETLPFFFADSRMGLVQGRWGHLNDQDGLLTRAQAIGIDGHFMIEQSARTFNGLFMNFNGTAGVWRREAIDDAGGWSGDTLTEDLDLSYRAQLAGWHTHFIAELEARAELPTSIGAFKSQQFRWAKGSIQTARKLLPSIWRSPASLWAKIQASLHLTHYAVHPLMLAVALLALPVMYILPKLSGPLYIPIMGVIFLSMMAPNSLYVVSQRRLYPQWFRRVLWLPLLSFIGVGLAVSNSRGVLEALAGRESDFVRTPKRGDGPTPKAYGVKTPILPWIELALGVYCAASFVFAIHTSKSMLSFFLFVYTGGFLAIGAGGVWEWFAELRRRRARQPSPHGATVAAPYLQRSPLPNK